MNPAHDNSRFNSHHAEERKAILIYMGSTFGRVDRQRDFTPALPRLVDRNLRSDGTGAEGDRDLRHFDADSGDRPSNGPRR